MKFLSDLGFDDNDIKQVEVETPELLLDEFKKASVLVTDNIKFLKELGIINYKDVVKNYADMFMMDSCNFQHIFLKYEKEDLIDKIAKNVRIVEHL